MREVSSTSKSRAAQLIVTSTQVSRSLSDTRTRSSGGLPHHVSFGRLRALATAAALISLVACGPPPENTRLTVLTLNLRGVMDVPCGNATGNYRFRYSNVGTGLQASGAVPDVIALQEVNAWTWCTFNHRMIPDYAPLDELISALEAGTGVRYQIAYLTALTFAQGNFHCSTDGQEQHACQAMSGLALLYNPNRVRNLMTDTTIEDAAEAFPSDAPRQEGAHLQRSLPCCNPAVGSEISSRIDGPAQTDKCNRETPAGLAWISGNVAALARLEWTDSPGAVFHVYNVHLAWQPNEHPGDVDSANAAVSALEEHFGSSRWIPPIIMGDFNNKSNETTLSEFPRFDYRGSAPVDDWILSGKPADSGFSESHRTHQRGDAESPRIRGRLPEPSVAVVGPLRGTHDSHHRIAVPPIRAPLRHECAWLSASPSSTRALQPCL